MVVHQAFATVLASLPRHEGTLGKMRLSPIAKAWTNNCVASRELRPNVASVGRVLPRGNRVCFADGFLRKPRTKSLS